MAPIDTQNSSTVATDPFVWWAATSPKSLEKTPGTFARNASKRPANYNANHRRKTSVRERRQVVVGLLTGTAVVGILGIGGISFARFIESTKQSQFGNTQTAFTNNTTSTSSSFTNSRHNSICYAWNSADPYSVQNAKSATITNKGNSANSAIYSGSYANATTDCAANPATTYAYANTATTYRNSDWAYQYV